MRALGYIPDPPKGVNERPDFDAALRFDRFTPPSSADLTSRVVEVLDQGRLGSCVAQAALQAIRIRDQIERVNAEPPLGSRLFLYYLSRATHHATGYDTGTNYRSAFGALARFGVPPEDAWPYDDKRGPGAAFMRMPPGDAFRRAFDARRTIRYERIYDVGDTRLDLLRRALSDGFPVCFGLDVTERFIEGKFDPAAPIEPFEQKRVGGHAMVLVGYRPSGFVALNSWGRGWGEAGTCLLSNQLVRSQLRDLWVVHAGAMP